jgi:hypothetical protein
MTAFPIWVPEPVISIRRWGTPTVVELGTVAVVSSPQNEDGTFLVATWHPPSRVSGKGRLGTQGHGHEGSRGVVMGVAEGSSGLVLN